MILLIDNYDSFVYNLARYTQELGFATEVIRNDQITLSEIGEKNPSHIIISPGPCTPFEAGISIELIKTMGPSIPILGVCLGHQAIAAAYGGKIIRAIKPMHGKASLIYHTSRGIFKNMKNPQWVGRYHSLVVSPENFPAELEITATVGTEIMGIQHRHYSVFGVQFHPESILTKEGYGLLRNFLEYS